jgi:hypothetical protein
MRLAPDEFAVRVDLKPDFRTTRVRPAKVLAPDAADRFAGGLLRFASALRSAPEATGTPVVEKVDATASPNPKNVRSLNRSRPFDRFAEYLKAQVRRQYLDPATALGLAVHPMGRIGQDAVVCFIGEIPKFRKEALLQLIQRFAIGDRFLPLQVGRID